jgi:hypothetical protein
MCNWILLCGKNCSKRHSLMIAERLQRPNSGCWHSEAVVGAFQWWQWRHERQATFWTAMHSMRTMKWRASWSAHLRE